ncbi:MAG: hypothetical protein ACI4JN_02765 [Ruminococcus sp.]
MKQRELYRFSRNAAKKGGCADIALPIVKIMSLYGVYFLISLAGAYAVCRYFFFRETVLAWCAFRYILQITLILMTVKSRCRIIRECIVRISLPCGYERKICRKLRRLYLLRSAVRLICRIITCAVIFLGISAMFSDFFQAKGIYRIMTAFQAVPVLIIIVRLRIRLMLRFFGAEILTVSDTQKSILRNLRESGKMLSGQYGFIAVMFLRSIPGLILPFLLPKFIQTLVSYFSVRHIEWQYEVNSNYEQTDIQSGYKRTCET